MPRLTRDLSSLILDPYAVQVADYRMESDGVPPCFCESRGFCLGDCPYCRVGGFVLHKPGDEW